MRIRGVMEALSYSALPDDGTDEERLFVWLCHVNHILPYRLRLSDTELHQLAESIGKGVT